MKETDLLTAKIIGCCFKVHREIGPGFNEKIYQNALTTLFNKENINYITEKEYEVKYLNARIGIFRADIVVEEKVIVEIKAVTGDITKLFEKQVISYLKSSGHKIGLLINFGNESCQIKRLVS
ncbi:MAG: GxxExxY protein [Elusimicrobiota bacterium]